MSNEPTTAPSNSQESHPDWEVIDTDPENAHLTEEDQLFKRNPEPSVSQKRKLPTLVASSSFERKLEEALVNQDESPRPRKRRRRVPFLLSLGQWTPCSGYSADTEPEPRWAANLLGMESDSTGEMSSQGSEQCAGAGKSDPDKNADAETEVAVSHEEKENVMEGR